MRTLKRQFWGDFKKVLGTLLRVWGKGGGEPALWLGGILVVAASTIYYFRRLIPHGIFVTKKKMWKNKHFHEKVKTLQEKLIKILDFSEAGLFLS